MRQDWGEWRVAFFDEEQRWRSLPVAWTSVAPLDPFVQVAAGRSPLRFADLLRLSYLLASLMHDRGEDEGR